MKWTFFAGAVILAWWFLLTAGAPPSAVVAGTAGVALWNYRQRRSKHAR